MSAPRAPKRTGMGELLPLHDPQNRSRVLRRIRKLWDEGSVEFVEHAETRMKERQLDVHDIHNILHHGQITEISRPHTRWRYTIVGKSIEDKRAKCVVEVNGRLIVVTVVDLTRPRTKKGDKR